MSASGAAPVGGGDAAPPPVPARPSQPGYSGYSSSYGGFGTGYSGYTSPYGGMYSSPYSGMYGSYSGYGGYGMGGLGYNRYGAYGQTNEFNSFARMAEESSRPAFQSIESIVGAFSSVSMMLDSTFQAVYNSFRAVVGVADNFGRMKTQFAQIFSAFAVFRTLRYLYRKLLVLLRLRPPGYAEEAWVEAGDSVMQAAASAGPDGKKSSWPVLMFFAIIMGGPWLIWKFLKSAFSKGSSPGWADGTEDHFVATAMYDYKGDGQDELSFRAGVNVNVAPKELQPRVKGWLLASVDGKKIGLIPANYIKVLGKRRGTVANQIATTQQTLATEHSGSIPNDRLSQTGAPSFSPTVPNRNEDHGTSSGLIHTPSSVTLQNDSQVGFGAESSNQDLDRIFGGAVENVPPNGSGIVQPDEKSDELVN